MVDEKGHIAIESVGNETAVITDGRMIKAVRQSAMNRLRQCFKYG